MADQPLVLVIEDDPGVAELIGDVLDTEGITVLNARSSAEAIRLIEAGPRPGALVLDLMLNGGDGEALHHGLKERGITIPTVIVSGRDDAPGRAAQIGAAHVTKPFDVDHLAAVVRDALGVGR
ncbi:MAG: response regulator [Dehalococcoidia bacterium]